MFMLVLAEKYQDQLLSSSLTYKFSQDDQQAAHQARDAQAQLVSIEIEMLTFI